MIDVIGKLSLKTGDLLLLEDGIIFIYLFSVAPPKIGKVIVGLRVVKGHVLRIDFVSRYTQCKILSHIDQAAG